MNALDKAVKDLTKDNKDLEGKYKFGQLLFLFNQGEKRKEISKTWTIGNLSINFYWASSKNFMGRFGGGWNWSLAVFVGSREIYFNLIFFRLTFRWKPQPNKKG